MFRFENHARQARVKPRPGPAQLKIFNLQFLIIALITGFFAAGNVVRGQVINESDKFVANDAVSDAALGSSISIDNGIIAVGAPSDDDNGANSGSTYLFNAANGNQIFKLLPQDGAAGEEFGFSVAVKDGIVAVGAKSDGELGAGAGAVYLFNAATGAQLYKLLPDDGEAGDEFGFSVDIDNGIVVIGSKRDDDNGADAGAAYLFNVATGAQTGKLVADDGTANDNFGCAVAIDNGIVAVGAQGEWVGNLFQAGSAYLFDASTGAQQHKLIADNAAISNFFGSAIAIHDGLVAVGAWARSVVLDHSGAAYIFDATDGSQLHYITPADGFDKAHFGISIAIDNGVVAIGADQDDDNGFASGSAYLYNANTGVLVNKLLSGDGLASDKFGSSVAIHGGVTVVGSPADDYAALTNAGSMYVFGTTIATPTGLTASNISSSSVDLSWNDTSSEYRVVRTSDAPAQTPSSGTLVYQGSNTQVTATGLTEGQGYYFTVYGKAGGSDSYSSGNAYLLATITAATTVSNPITGSQTGTIAFGASGVSIDITTNGDADGGTVLVEQFNTPSTGDNSISGTVTAPDGSTVTPNVISQERHWTITSDLTGTNSFTVTFDVSDLSGLSNPDRLIILKRNEAGWVAQNTTRNGDFLSATVSSFSDFGIGANSTDNSLPVELASFSATAGDGQVTLRWVTESEVNNDAFIIERSLDGENFEVIEEIPGHGSTSEQHIYRFSDQQVFNGIVYYYRLSDRDYNGVITTHNVVSAVPNSAGIVATGPVGKVIENYHFDPAYPNPFNPETTLRFAIPNNDEKVKQVRLHVYNMLGQRVATLYEGPLSGGEFSMKWNGLNDYGQSQPSGVYVIRFSSRDYVDVQRVVLVR